MLVTGAGPVGLLAALIGAQRGLEVHVLDRRDGSKLELVARLGGTIHDAISAVKPDIVIECTGARPWSARVGRTAPDGIVCLAGVSAAGHQINFDIGELNRTMVLENDVVFGSVNANRRHYETPRRAGRPTRMA